MTTTPENPDTGAAAAMPTGDEDRLQAYVDGALDDGARADFERLMAADPELAERARVYASQKRRLAAALAIATAPVGDPYTATLADALARRLAPPPRFRWLRRFAMAAALMAVGWWGHDLARTADQPVPDLVADAAEIHELFADDPEHPVELSAAESGELTAWMSRQLGEGIAPPNLTALGLTFLGGRRLGSQAGPFAQLLYESRDGSRVGLYLSRPVGAADQTIQMVRVDDLNAGYWQEDDLAYAIVAEASVERLLTIATRLGAAGRL
jgi:anti-sigma factor RsiW